MKYELSKHAIRRMKERKINKEDIEQALDFPTKVLYNSKENKFLIKKLYKRGDKQSLLLIIVNPEKDPPRIITIINTSKIKKYL